MRRPVVNDGAQALKRLENHPPGQAGFISIEGQSFHFQDAPTFVHAYRQIFKNGVYDFPCIKGSPVILDCGANIGVAVRFWAKKFPSPTIIAFEADPAIFEVLNRNVQLAANCKIELHQAAAWSSRGFVQFKSTGLEGGHLDSVPCESNGETICVPTVRLREYLTNTVDLLKIDIEGAEVDVLLDCGDALSVVERIYVEYHSYPSSPQRLNELLDVLRTNGFRFYLQSETTVTRPLNGIKPSFGMDQRLDIWAWRE